MEVVSLGPHGLRQMWARVERDVCIDTSKRASCSTTCRERYTGFWSASEARFWVSHPHAADLLRRVVLPPAILGLGLLEGPRERRFFMSEVPLHSFPTSHLLHAAHMQQM